MYGLRLAAVLLLSIAPIGATAAPPAPAARVAAARPVTIAAFDRQIALAKSAMLVDPRQGLARGREAAAIADRLAASRDKVVAQATARWLQAEALLRLNDPHAADRAIAPALRQIQRTAPGTKLHGDLLQSNGEIVLLLGRIQPALQDLQRAHNIYRDVGDARSQARTLMNIASIYNNAGDFEKVLQYYAQAAEVYAGDPNFDVSTHNNRGNALRDLHRFREAEVEYRKALVAAQKLGSPLLQARILTNIAFAEQRSGKLDEAAANANRGLRIAQDPAAAGWRPFLYGVKAELALGEGDLDQAAALIARTFDGIDLRQTAMPFRDFHELAHRLYARRGDDKLALAHLEAFKRLDDESRTVAASTNAALMAARFDFANQDLRITKLKAGQLQRDVMLAQSRARLHTIATYGVGGVALVIFGLLSFGYIKIRRSRDEVRAANTSLSTANVALEKALKAKTEFLATTSHEIRTPLNGILGMTQVILHDPSVSGPLRERIEVVQGAGETMKVLVDDILDVAKMETGAIVLDRAEMDLRHLLSDVVRLWDGQARGKGLDLQLDLADAPTRIVEDQTRLRQILFNLLSNAIKFTEQGSVRLSVSVQPGAEGEHLRIAIADTGIGITADQHERIFEAFHQVDGGTTRRYGGTGLGLAICRNLATAMGGTVALDSAPDKGSTFIVSLPLRRSGNQAVAEPRSSGGLPSRLAETRLLVIERNPLAQSILRATIEGQVAEYDVVESGEAAIALLAGRPFDAIVAEGVSLTIPAIDSFASLAALAAAAPDATITVLWAGLTEEDRAALMAHGAARVLAKPIAAKALLHALQAPLPGAGMDGDAQTGSAPLLTIARKSAA